MKEKLSKLDILKQLYYYHKKNVLNCSFGGWLSSFKIDPTYQNLNKLLTIVNEIITKSKEK